MTVKTNAILLLSVRSALNVGAITRSSAAFDVKRIYIGPGTPYPRIDNDPRLPHIATGASSKIAKTALGAERFVDFQPVDNVRSFLRRHTGNYNILALEQSARSQPLHAYAPPTDRPWLLIVGHETEGIPQDILAIADDVLEIPHSSNKESLNVSVATGIALFWLQHRAG